MRQYGLNEEEMKILKFMSIKDIDREIFIAYKNNIPFQHMLEKTDYTNIEFVKTINCINDRLFVISQYGLKNYKKIVKQYEEILYQSYLDKSDIRHYIRFIKGDLPWRRRSRINRYDEILSNCINIISSCPNIEKIYLSTDIII